MGCYKPQTVSQIASIVDDVCKALQEDGLALSTERKEALALRILELYDSGITKPDVLRLEVMADSLWASNSSHPTSVRGPREGDRI